MIATRTMLLALCSFTLLSPVYAQHTVGWRTDGTGRYPHADPPKVWGPDKNVVWKTKTATFSVATPVIVGAKIFTCADPTTLVCLNKADGKILWEQKSTRAELPWTEEEKDQLKAERAQADIWSKQRQVLQKQMSVLEKQMSVLEKMLAKDKEKAKEIRKKIDEIRKPRDELDAKRKTLPHLMRATEPHRDGTAGYSQCTPVSNGKQIFVAFGNGLVACHDLDGTRRWLKLMEHSTLTYGHGASPVLVGDKLLVHYADLVALDIKDGSESWRQKIPPNYGTAIPTHVGGISVVLTPTGFMVRVADGKILADNLGSCGPNSPILHDGIAYFIASNARAVKLPPSPTDKFESLWKANVKGAGYWFSSPVYHDGLIYAVSATGLFNVLDAQTGKLVYDIRHELGGSVYPSICLAGNLIYLSSDNGKTIVLEPGREYKEIARNTLETFRSTPVFEGRRMYIRTQNHFWCIGE